MTKLDVSIVVCTFNRCGHLEAALQDLVRQDTQAVPLGYEVVVVNDASTDATDDVIERIAKSSRVPVRGVHANGTGVAHARNVGLANAQGAWVAFFDDDQRASSEWLGRLMAAASTHGADFAGGPIVLDLPQNAELGPTCRAIYGEHPPRWWQRKTDAPPLPAGGNRLIRRHVFETIGIHDESLSSGGEDLDLLLRAVSAGCRFTWANDAVVYHIVSEERLDPGHIRAYCRQAGAGRAFAENKGKGRGGLLAAAGLQIGKLLLGNLPMFWWAQLRGLELDILDSRARFWLGQGYVKSIIGRLLPSPFGVRLDSESFRDLRS